MKKSISSALLVILFGVAPIAGAAENCGTTVKRYVRDHYAQLNTPPVKLQKVRRIQQWRSLETWEAFGSDPRGNQSVHVVTLDQAACHVEQFLVYPVR